MLTISRVNIAVFKGHSAHAASISKTALSELSVLDILERGCWSNSSIWQKFYNKHFELIPERFHKSFFNEWV